MSSFPFQRLLTLNMDNYFLMERLLSHEKPPARKYNKRKGKGEGEADGGCGGNTEAEGAASVDESSRLGSRYGHCRSQNLS